MKLIVNESERGFLFKNGRFVRMLEPGKHIVHTWHGGHYVICNIAKPVDVRGVDISVLSRDKAFADSVIGVNVPDGHLGIHLEDGRIVEALAPGSYCFWNIGFCEHTFRIIDTSDAAITDLTPVQLASLPKALYSKFEVPEGHVAALCIDGKFCRMLTGGSYYFWNNAQHVTCQCIDLRAQLLDIAGQEILTADKVSLRINFVCTYQVADAEKIFLQLKDYQAQIYAVTQLALREYIGKYRLDELLEQKQAIAAFVLHALQTRQEGLFVTFSDAGIKDIILPGEMREIMNAVLVAEKAAQANVIARREEVASTRSLLNTAKLMDENATLYKLKELEYLEKICDKVGNISVGGGDLLAQLRAMIGDK